MGVVFSEGGDKLKADAVAGEAERAVGGVFPEGDVQVEAVGAGVVPRRFQQGSEEEGGLPVRGIAPGGEFLHSAKAGDSCAA